MRSSAPQTRETTVAGGVRIGSSDLPDTGAAIATGPTPERKVETFTWASGGWGEGRTCWIVLADTSRQAMESVRPRYERRGHLGIAL